MAKKRVRRRKSLRSWFWIGGVLALLVIAAGVWFVTTSTKPPTQNVNALDVATSLSNTDTAFNVGTRAGQPAAAFTLLDARGNPYALQPGNGRKYVLAFNMGYV